MPFKKGRLIYALNFAKSTKRPNLVLVEGNIDVITLHQAGFDNVVATMGTALTEEHARILARYTRSWCSATTTTRRVKSPPTGCWTF